MEKNTAFEDSEAYAASSLGDCMAACDNDRKCTGFDWSPVVPPSWRCWFFGSGQKKTYYGFTHYKLHRHCTGKLLLLMVYLLVKNIIIANICAMNIRADCQKGLSPCWSPITN